MARKKNANALLGKAANGGTNGGKPSPKVVEGIKKAERRRIKRVRKRQAMQMIGADTVTAEEMVGYGNAVLNSSGVHMRGGAIGTLGRGVRFGAIPRNIKIGRTFESNMAFLKALSPALEIGHFKWPDNNTADTITLENRDILDIPAPDGIKDTETWSMNIYLTPLPDCPLLLVRWIDGKPQPDINAVNSGQVALLQPVNADWSKPFSMLYSQPYNKEGKYPGNSFQTLRITSRSVTADLVATALENKGTIYGGQNGVDLQYMPLPPATLAKMTLNHLVRVLAKMKLSEVNNPGDFAQLFAKELAKSVVDDESMAKIASASATDEVDALRAEPEPPVDQTGYFEVMQQLPNDIIELGELDKKYTQWEAKHGIYMPLKLAASSRMEFVETSKQYHLCPLKPTETESRWGHHVMHGNSWQMGFVFMRNLHHAAKINCKFITTFEGTPLPGTILTKVATPAGDPDTVGWQRCATIMSRLPSAHVSAANALGSILDTIGQFLNNSGIPVLKDLGGLTQTPLGKKVTGWLDNVL